MRRWLILIAFFGIISGIIGICSAYTPPSYDSVNLTLETPYTPPSYNSVNLTLGEGGDTTPPTSNSPSDASYTQNSQATIGWILQDETGAGNYTVYRNGTIQNSSTAWINNINLNVWVNTTTIGNNWNYTIYFNDSSGNEGTPDSVFINITPPYFTVILNSPANETITNDNTPDFNFTVTGSENSYSCELFINDSGYGKAELEDDTEDSYSCEGGFNSGTPCSNAVDENWDTYASRIDTSDGTSYVYENYTIPSYLSSANWTSKSICSSDSLCLTTNVYYWNYTSGSYSNLLSESPGTYIVTIPEDGLSGQTLSIKTGVSKSYGYRSNYVEGKVIWIGITQNNTPTIITANQSLSDGTYNWYINCTANSITNQSETREITIDTTPSRFDIIETGTTLGGKALIRKDGDI